MYILDNSQYYKSEWGVFNRIQGVQLLILADLSQQIDHQVIDKLLFYRSTC